MAVAGSLDSRVAGEPNCSEMVAVGKRSSHDFGICVAGAGVTIGAAVGVGVCVCVGAAAGVSTAFWLDVAHPTSDMAIAVIATTTTGVEKCFIIGW